MKIAIISDIHDNLVNLRKCLDWCQDQEIEVLICCGDVTNSETLEFMSVNFEFDIYLARGNMEIYDEDEPSKYKNIKNLGRVGRFELAGKTIGICHEPHFVKEVLKLGKCDIVFCGHTHKPWIGEREGVDVVNPGTLGGVFQKGSFAFWDIENNQIDLKVLEHMF